jgi:hypothetical protein
MCPACIGTAALIYASITSAGGITALVVKTRRSKPVDEGVEAPTVNEPSRSPPPENAN